jgi:hypothetical protein
MAGTKKYVESSGASSPKKDRPETALNGMAGVPAPQEDNVVLLPAGRQATLDPVVADQGQGRPQSAHGDLLLTLSVDETEVGFGIVGRQGRIAPFVPNGCRNTAQDV